MTPSAFDDTLAPPGRHTVTVWGQWHPYSLASGQSWDAVGAGAGERLVAAVDAVAPGFAASVQQLHVQTPADLERELGLLHGNVMHVEMALDAMFAWRPLPELARHRVPGVPGLYLTGASTHPGGGVFGASGRTVADIVLADRTPSRPARAVGTVGRLPAPAVGWAQGWGGDPPGREPARVVRQDEPPAARLVAQVPRPSGNPRLGGQRR